MPVLWSKPVHPNHFENGFRKQKNVTKVILTVYLFNCLALTVAKEKEKSAKLAILEKADLNLVNFLV